MKPMSRWLGPLGVRLASAFIAVALAAVAVLAIAVLLVDRGDVNHLAATQRVQTTDAISAALEDSYQASQGWSGANLEPAVFLAETSGVGLALDDLAGESVLRAGPQRLFTQDSSTITAETVSSGQKPVGKLHLAFASGGLTTSERHLRTTLIDALGWSAGLAAGVALVVAVVVARAVIRPIRRLSAAVAALEDRKTDARVGPDSGPGELGELGRAFDSMAESLEREDRLRRALVADVAHELRTPVAILQADTEAILDGLSLPTAETIQSLHDETVRLGRMVEDLQTLASAEAAGLHLERRPLDLSRVAADAADSLASRFRSAGVRLEPNLPPTIVLGDPHRLRQVATNLLSNAVKFTSTGGQVTLRVERDNADAVLEVSDTGPGIPQAEQPLVWDRFYRGQAATPTPGSGIGLAVVKELVSAHGGTVSLESRPGGGARFTVRLPLAVTVTTETDS